MAPSSHAIGSGMMMASHSISVRHLHLAAVGHVSTRVAATTTARAYSSSSSTRRSHAPHPHHTPTHGLSLSASRPGKAGGLQRPSQNTSSSRSRDGTTRRGFAGAAAIETTLAATQHVFSQLHSVAGMPWWLAIPYVALTVNLVARLPLTVYCRRVAQRRAELTPLLRAWYARHARDVHGETLGSDDDGTSKLARSSMGIMQKETAARFRATSKRLYRRFGAQQWKDYLSFAVFPFWLTAIEALRRLCGGPRGLLGNLVFGAKSGGDGAASQAAAADVAKDPDFPSPSDATVAFAKDANAGSVTPVDAAVQIAGDQVLPLGADPSLATGGCLWFPDLMVPDPLHVLPFMLSAMLVLNIMPKTERGIRALFGLQGEQSAPAPGSGAASPTVAVGENKGRQRLQRALMAVALLVGPATMGLPAALHLYWISSSAITLIQTETISRLMPMPKFPAPCTGSENILIRPRRSKKA